MNDNSWLENFFETTLKREIFRQGKIVINIGFVASVAALFLYLMLYGLSEKIGIVLIVILIIGFAAIPHFPAKRSK